MSETIAFQLKPGQRYAESGDSGVVIHVGGTASGKVYLTPQQAIALKAGGPESIFENVQSQEQQFGQTQTGEETEETDNSAKGEQTGETNPRAHAEEITAFLSRPVKEITASLEEMHDAKFISELHDRETAAPKPRQAVVDALNSRYDAVMAKQK